MRLPAILLLCAVLCLCCACTSTPTGRTLCITELQSAGGETDWIELYNYGELPVPLQGWYLSDDPETPGKSPLPLYTLLPGERLVLTAGDTLTFRLSAAGETVVLSDPQGTAVQTIAVPASVPGLSYGSTETDSFSPAQFVWYATPTPGEDNSHGMLLGDNTTDTRYGVRINEYVSRNKSTLYDSAGDYGDWIELYNTSEAAVDLSGWALTDAEDDLSRWLFPAGTTLPAGGYLLVFCDGKDSAGDGELHTNFRLSENDGFLGLYTADGAFCSGVTCGATEQDVAFGCDNSGKTIRCRYPTPGRANAVETEVAE